MNPNFSNPNTQIRTIELTQAGSGLRKTVVKRYIFLWVHTIRNFKGLSVFIADGKLGENAKVKIIKVSRNYAAAEKISE